MNQIYKVCAPGYVAAIIQGTYHLSLWLMSVPKSRLDTLRVESMTGLESYPFELVEFKKNGGTHFIHVSEDTTTERLKSTLVSCGAEVLATYRIEKDFQGDPKHPGRDYMGVLDHVHEKV